ncbi:tetratricopeptide repeat protein [Gemmatimonas sp.]|uniref:tetratricopeptide repeat protein n=1 Tax=Gemmatimonas sp. TaxID=1962908 RepID=UPI0039832431
MSKFTSRPVQLALVAFAAGAALLGYAAIRPATVVPKDIELPESPIALEAELRAEDIALFERRSAEDPYGASDRARLATLFLQRARETGNVEDYRRAEAKARESLALRPEHNGGARLALASSLLARHRFPEALAAARDLVAADEDKPASRALLGELELEMGDYDHARVTFDKLWQWRANLAVSPRLARWAELTGKTGLARSILRAAREQADARGDLPREQVAWFHLRVADFELRRGDLPEAALAIRNGLAIDARDPRLLSVAARLAALRGDWQEVIALGQRIGDRADLATMALIGDAHLATGDSARAERQFRAVERSAAANPEPFNRQWTLFRLEHERELSATLALLQGEIRTRRDVYGYDQLAWALHLSGDHLSARTAVLQAMRLGTPDANLYYHRGMIEQALGHDESARSHLHRALELNAHFHPVNADRARRELRAISERQ